MIFRVSSQVLRAQTLSYRFA